MKEDSSTNSLQPVAQRLFNSQKFAGQLRRSLLLGLLILLGRCGLGSFLSGGSLLLVLSRLSRCGLSRCGLIILLGRGGLLLILSGLGGGSLLLFLGGGSGLGSNSTSELFELLGNTLLLADVVLCTSSLSLLGKLLLTNLLLLHSVDGLNKHSLVLEEVTL